ncbi:cytochrome P450 [Nemania sp. FL0031]|nr:cytochrome P450 [Nemania sp. FL0031]
MAVPKSSYVITSSEEQWRSFSLASFLIFFTASAIILHYFRSWKRLAHIPGPTAAQVSILWLLKQAWNGNLFPTLVKAGDKYGKLVRIGPNLLLCSDPDELRRISGIRSEYTKGPAYDAGRVADGEPHVASERDPVKHKQLRAKMGVAYSMDVQPALDRQISSLIDLIDSKYVSNGTITKSSSTEEKPRSLFMDFGQKMHFYALDCIGDFVMGEPFGFLKRDEDINNMTQINDLSLRIVTVAGLVPSLVKLRSWWPVRCFLPKKGDRVGFGILFDFAKDLVDRRTAPNAQPVNDMMQAFIRSGMTKSQLMQQVYIHIIAGSDTTSNWARMTLLCLLTCPTTYMALQKEIDMASASGQLSSPMATEAEVRNLPYLDAVLREALRLHPPSVSPSKLSPVGKTGEGDIVCGYIVPGGTQVGANVPGILKSKEIFGPDADCFRPERWLEVDDADRLRRMHSAADIVFGAGKFQCMGKAIAWMENRKLLVELIRRYDFAIVNNLKPIHVESLAIMVVHDFYVRVMRRTNREQSVVAG